MKWLYEVTISGRTAKVEVVPGEEGRFTFLLDGRGFPVQATDLGPATLALLHSDRSAEVSWRAGPEGFDLVLRGVAYRAVAVDERRRRLGGLAGGRGAAGPTTVRSAMPGKVVAVLVTQGQAVAAGQGLVVIEAMKMENELKAPVAGRVARIAVVPGGTVDGGQVLVELAPPEEAAG